MSIILYIMEIKQVFLVLILIIGSLLIYEIIRINVLKDCPGPTYVNVPRTFTEEQNSPIPLKEVFDDMFAKPSPWMMNNGVGYRSRLDTSLKNKTTNFI